MDTIKLALRALLIIAIWVPIICLLLFIPAGTLDYWQGWLFIGSLFIPMVFVFLYMISFDRELLSKRLNTHEERGEQMLIQLVNAGLFLALLIIAGFDHRFGWSAVPVWLVVSSDVLMFIAYVAFIGTMIHNAYASRVIEIQEGQKVVDSGPYSIVRHPMYAAGIVMYMAIPFVLGTYWGLIPMLLLPVMLILRILDEEKALIEDLKGYTDYMKKVKYRLIPFVW